jgi:hypothetical protein
MYSTNISNVDENARLSPEVVRQRARTEDTAQRLSLVAMRQWEKALSGVIALPAAAALSTAAGFLFGASILERIFESLESTVSEVGRRVGREYDAQGEPIFTPKDRESRAS